MAPRLTFVLSGRLFSSTYKIFLIAAVFWPHAAHAKDALITAIELFDGPSGAAYVQATEILINGKTELRGCNSVSKIDKDTYGKLPKIPLVGAIQLERTAEGILILTRNSEATCVLPSNLRFEKDWGNSVSALADHALLQGRVLSSSPPGVTTLPPLKPGVKLVFVNEPNTEMAEYLRAERAHNIGAWQDFVGRYPHSRYSGTAKQALSALHEKEA
ncbi:MAG: hypothetical protein JOZ14_16935, partial [Acidobacteria bacterium]|nr:hypothetical protein [Acidobacteriota bacterium]